MELVEDELTGSLINRTGANLTNIRCVRGLISEDPKQTQEVRV